MRKKIIWLLCFVGIIAFFTGCGSDSTTVNEVIVEEQTSTKEESTVTNEGVSDAVEYSSEESQEISEESVSEATVIEQEVSDVPLYDRTYLEKDGEGYIYRLSDSALIKKYDELYAEAFADVIASYNEVMEWMDQDYESNQPTVVSNLLFKENTTNSVINTGTYFEMDINFDLNNMGYTYVDLDSDGVFELILGVASYEYNEGLPMDVYERAYTLVDGKAIKILEGGARINQWLGYDGHIYEYGSGGAAYSGTWRLHFDKTRISPNGTDWGDEGFVEDEFVGYWNSPVHIMGPIEDIDKESLLPENHVADDEWEKIEEEWNNRRVRIDWLKMSDYLMLYYPEGI